MPSRPKLHLLVPKKHESVEPSADELFHVADWPMHYLLAIDRYHVRNMALVLSAYGCSPLTWRVLSILADRDGHTIQELAEVSVIERSNLSRIVDSMEKDGLLTRGGHPEDKRQTQVFITNKGRGLFSRSLPDVLKYYAIFLTGISPAEMTVLMSVLKKIKRNVRSYETSDVDEER